MQAVIIIIISSIIIVTFYKKVSEPLKVAFLALYHHTVVDLMFRHRSV